MAGYTVVVEHEQHPLPERGRPGPGLRIELAKLSVGGSLVVFGRKLASVRLAVRKAVKEGLQGSYTSRQVMVDGRDAVRVWRSK